MEFKSNKIGEPFLTVLNHNGSVDYKCRGEDHEYVQKLGYAVKMGGDCSMYAPGLHGISLSSYGDWGSVYADFMDETSKDIFIDMVEKDIIKLWRCDIYINRTHYTFDGNGWRCYADKRWSPCEAPKIGE